MGEGADNTARPFICYIRLFVGVILITITVAIFRLPSAQCRLLFIAHLSLAPNTKAKLRQIDCVELAVTIAAMWLNTESFHLPLGHDIVTEHIDRFAVASIV